VAIVGAGPGALECALTIARQGQRREVVVFDERAEIGGNIGIATKAPHRHGWRLLIDFYERQLDGTDVQFRLGHRVGREDLAGFEEVIVAIGASEVLPQVAGIETAVSTTALIDGGVDMLAGASSVLVVDDGLGWWPTASSVEVAIAAGVGSITVASPGGTFGATLPPDGRVQMMPRLKGAPLDFKPFLAFSGLADGIASFTHVISGAQEQIGADRIIVTGERRALPWDDLVVEGANVTVIGDAAAPRRVSHALSEGRVAGDGIYTGVFADVKDLSVMRAG
jgi:2,4-dienoyl-CoA reductase (NADPH2)